MLTLKILFWLPIHSCPGLRAVAESSVDSLCMQMQQAELLHMWHSQEMQEKIMPRKHPQWRADQ